MKTRPLFGRSPLFGVSVKREFTVAMPLDMLLATFPDHLEPALGYIVYFAWVNQKCHQYCIPTYSKVQSPACHNSTAVEITQAGSKAMLLERSTNTKNW